MMEPEKQPNGDRITELWETAHQVGITRRKFLTLLAAGGATAVLIACGQKTTTTSSKPTTSSAKPATTSSSPPKPTTSSAPPPPPTSSAAPPPPAGGGGNPYSSVSTGQAPPPPPYSSGKMVLTSTTVKEGETIPDKYTSVGITSGKFTMAVTPPLQWTGAPAGTKSITIIGWMVKGGGDEGINWIVYNIPGDTKGVPEDVQGVGTVALAWIPPSGGSPGTFKKSITVYALSAAPKVTGTPDAPTLRDAMKDIILDTCTLNYNVIIS